MIRTKKELLEFMRAHPETPLEFCRSGHRGGWWRFGLTPVHASAARAFVASDLSVRVPRRQHPFISAAYELRDAP